jgi:mono/diheme cytochrome c family protein
MTAGGRFKGDWRRAQRDSGRQSAPEEGFPMRARRLRDSAAHSLVAILLALQAPLAAGDADRGGRAAPLLPQYRDECSACHVPYPPRLLPAESWRRITGNLSRHYGADASLDAATTSLLSRWLEANAGAGRKMREPPPDDRITRSAWFLHEHDEIPERTWRTATKGRPANCAACHTLADQGDFRERNIRIPR